MNKNYFKNNATFLKKIVYLKILINFVANFNV